MSDRMRRLQDVLAKESLDGLLVTDSLNMRYLTGFTGSYAVLLVTGDTAFLLTDSRYTEQAKIEAPHCALVIIETKNWVSELAERAQDHALHKIAFEDHPLSYHNWAEMRDALSSMELVPAHNLVEKLRLVKDSDEIEAIREAVRITDAAYAHVSDLLEPGLREIEIALELDFFMRKNGADKEAFDTVVASGPRSAMPHAKPTERTLLDGELLVMDFGARAQGYHADITRTVLLGVGDVKQEEIHATVLEAQQRAIDAIRPGVEGGVVDSAARDYIAERGYGDCFGHGLGHGLGLAVHDGGLLNKHSTAILEAGMVLTVEPGIYIPGWGGVRIEDDVLVTNTGCEVLTQSPKALTLG